MIDLKIDTASITDRGLNPQKPINEDSLLVMVAAGVFAVADGVGGAHAGDVASKAATEIIETMVSAKNDKNHEADVVSFSKDLIHAGNDIVHQLGKKHQRMMASTIAMMIIDKASAILSHVGDSRVYVYRDSELSQLTKDHSKLQAIAQNQGKELESDDKAADRNIITRALGAWPTVEPDIQKVILKDGDIYLLCTDGIYTHNTSAQIVEALHSNPDDLEKACETLKGNCYSEGAKDHLTAILLKIKKTADKTLSTEEHDLIDTVMHDKKNT